MNEISVDAVSTVPTNTVAAMNGNLIVRNDRGSCDLWRDGVGWWGFSLTEEQARRLANLYPTR